jgi:integral membrane protein
MTNNQTEINKKFLKHLRIISLAEGCSTIILFFVAMPMKYIWDIPQAVSWLGRIHGLLFILLITYAILAIKKIPISINLSFMLILASIFPFGPFLMDRKLKAL